MKIMSILEFQSERPEQYDCVTNKIIPVINKGKNVIVEAPIKSGKRELVEIFSALTAKSSDKKTFHYYICNMDRIDIKDQIDELRAYGIECLVGKDIRKTLSEKSKDIKEKSNNGNVICHIDESDYGSKVNQSLDDLLQEIYNFTNINFVFYSATSEEIKYSNLKDYCEVVTFLPAKNYCGYNFFLDNNLVQDATPFFNDDLSLSNQAIEIVTAHAQSNKQIGVIRLATSKVKPKKGGENKFYHLFNNDWNQKGNTSMQLKEIYKKYGKNLIVDFVNKDHAFFWGDEENNPGHLRSHIGLADNYCKLIIINQTSTRSTQWKCHNKIYFYHSYRKDTTHYNTIMQADGRNIHYNTSGNLEDSKIKIYGDIDCWLCASKRITDEEFTIRNNRKLTRDVNSISASQYKVKILVENDDDFKILPLKPRERENRIFYGKEYTSVQTLSKGGSRGVQEKDMDKGNANLARHIYNNRQALRDVHNTCVRIDGPQENAKIKPVGQAEYTVSWKEDFEKLYDLDKRIEPALKNKQKVYAVWIPSDNQIQLETSDKSLYTGLKN